MAGDSTADSLLPSLLRLGVAAGVISECAVSGVRGNFACFALSRSGSGVSLACAAAALLYVVIVFRIKSECEFEICGTDTSGGLLPISFSVEYV